MAVRLHFVAASDSVFSRREKKTRKIVFAVRQEMETDFLRASADRFVASIAEVGSSLEIDRSCFVDLAIAVADPFAAADSAVTAAVDFADSFGFAGCFRSAGTGPHRLHFPPFSAAVEAEGWASGLGSASAS